MIRRENVKKCEVAAITTDNTPGIIGGMEKKKYPRKRKGKKRNLSRKGKQKPGYSS